MKKTLFYLLALLILAALVAGGLKLHQQRQQELEGWRRLRLSSPPAEKTA